MSSRPSVISRLLVSGAAAILSVSVLAVAHPLVARAATPSMTWSGTVDWSSDYSDPATGNWGKSLINWTIVNGVADSTINQVSTELNQQTTGPGLPFGSSITCTGDVTTTTTGVLTGDAFDIEGFTPNLVGGFEYNSTVLRIKITNTATDYTNTFVPTSGNLGVCEPLHGDTPSDFIFPLESFFGSAAFDFKDLTGSETNGAGTMAWHLTNPDSDGDGLIDIREGWYGTDPLNPDSDCHLPATPTLCDGLLDGAEVFGATPEGTGPATNPFTRSNPLAADSDNDGFLDNQELAAVPPTDPLDAGSFPGNGGGTPSDTDDDGVSDGVDNCPVVANAAQSDWNHDGIGDACEDTDHDGFTDAQEILMGTNPADSRDPQLPSTTLTAGTWPVVGRGDIGITCGKTKFDWLDISGYGTGIPSGDGACVVLISNRIAQQALSMAVHSGVTLSEEFAADLAVWSAPDIATNLTSAYFSWRLSSWAYQGMSQLVPEAGTFFRFLGVTGLISNVAKYNAIALAAVTILDQIEYKGACVEFRLDPQSQAFNWRLVYNPNHITDKSLTVATVFKKKVRRFLPDTVQELQVNLSCDTNGRVQAGTTRDTGTVFTSPRGLLLQAP